MTIHCESKFEQSVGMVRIQQPSLPVNPSAKAGEPLGEYFANTCQGLVFSAETT